LVDITVAESTDIRVLHIAKTYQLAFCSLNIDRTIRLSCSYSSQCYSLTKSH